jgi:hypothetical protein
MGTGVVELLELGIHINYSQPSYYYVVSEPAKQNTKRPKHQKRSSREAQKDSKDVFKSRENGHFHVI